MAGNNTSWSNDSLFGEYGTNTSYLPLRPDPAYELFLVTCRFWIKRVCVPLVMCTGVLGNAVTIVVLTRRRMRSSTNHYLTALAFFDMFYLILAFTMTLDDYPRTHTTSYMLYQCYALMLIDACSYTSVWLTVMFTIERYVAVCHPMKGKVFCTRSRAKKVVVAVAAICCLVVIPIPFEFRVVEVVNDATNTVSSRRISSDFGKNETYTSVYYWFNAVTFTLLPLALLAVFNTYLIRSVHQSKTTRRKMTMRGRNDHHARQEHRITVMLIAVVIMFMACQMPWAGILLYTSFYAPVPNSNEDAMLRGIGNICNLLVGINAACNFVLYCALSDKYRRTFLHTFVPCMFRSASSPRHSLTNFNSGCTQYEGDTLGPSSTCGSFRQKRHSTKKTQHKDTNGAIYVPVSKANTDKDGFLKVSSPKSNGNAVLRDGPQENGVNHKPHTEQNHVNEIHLTVPNEDRNGVCNRTSQEILTLSGSKSSINGLTENIVHMTSL